MTKDKPFKFKQSINILKSTGQKANNLRELRNIIASVQEGALFHHMYQYFLKGHILEYTNDFAQWAGENLEERTLSEQLSNIDPYEFDNINDLRNRLLDVIDAYLKKFPEPRRVMKGGEFYFKETITIVFPIDVLAHTLEEFLIAIKYMEPGPIYYHFYEARMRHGTDDFSRWIEDIHKRKQLAYNIRAIDPFMHSIEGIRNHIITAVENELKKELKENLK